jgi:hypothetical protein
LVSLLQNNYFQSKNQALHAKVEKVELMPQGALQNLELEAENRTLNENAEQKADNQVHPLFPANLFKWEQRL